MKNEPLYYFIGQMATDQRLSVTHLCLYAAIAYLGKDQSPGEHFSISRKMLLRHSGIRSITTYHKRLSELVRFGYIRYEPSYHPFRGSQVAFII